jgi:hypothetical protein
VGGVRSANEDATGGNVDFEINEEGMQQLAQELEAQLPPISVPLEGSEADAVQSVKEQLIAMGAEPNDDAEIAQIVREARESHGNS